MNKPPYANNKIEQNGQAQVNESIDLKNNLAEIKHTDRMEDDIYVNDTQETMKSQPLSVDISNMGDNFANLNQLEEKDLKIAITKLRKQNEDLRGQLKDLSDKLTDVLAKSKSKQKLKDDKPKEFKEDTLIKEIENSKQQIEQYKKEAQHLKNRLEFCSSEDRIIKLETILKQREQMLQDLITESKNLQKINRDQEKEINSYYKEQGFEHKVNACTQEIASLREKMREVQQISRMNEKNFKKQQEYLTNLNHQYGLICEKIGVSPSFSFSVPEELDLYLESKAKGDLNTFQNQNMKNNGELAKNIDPRNVKEMEEKLKDLLAREDILQKQLQSLDKKNQFTISKLKTEIADIQKQTKDVELKLQEKEKEVYTLDKKVSDLKRVTRNNSMGYGGTGEEVPNLSNSSSVGRLGELKNGLSDNHKASAPILKDVNLKEIANKDTTGSNQTIKTSEIKEVPIIRDVMGGRSGAGLYEFSDKDVLNNLFATKIVKLTLWLGESFINGIQASYSVNNSEDIIGNENLAADMKIRTKVVESLQLDADDKISHIAGKYNEGLVCLKFQTAKGKIKVFGDNKSLGEEFEIEIESGEYPTLLFGALCKKKDKKGREEIILANIGFTLVKKAKK